MGREAPNGHAAAQKITGDDGQLGGGSRRTTYLLLYRQYMLLLKFNNFSFKVTKYKSDMRKMAVVICQ